MNRITRRTFVGQAGALAAFTVVPRHVLGRGFLAPSDRLHVACIGIGGMGRNDVRNVAKAGGTIYALCDVDARMAEDAFNTHPQAKRYRDFREMLVKEERNIDAVTISTPDHTHAAAAMMAMKAGKHVYCQKPLARTIGEVRALMEQARKSPKLVTQMGNQGHAGDGTRLIRELYEAGAIGKVREIQYYTNRPIWPQGMDRPLQAYNVPPWLDWNLWLGPAPDRPYAPDYAPFRWRGWWDFGTGALGDIAAHSMDAAFWTLDLGYPSRIEAESSRVYAESAPKYSRIVYDFPAKGSRPALRVIWRDGELAGPRPAGLPAELSWPGYSDVGTQLWIGDDGQLLADAYGDRVLLLDAAKQKHFADQPPAPKYPRVESVHHEWLNAIKAGTQAGSSFHGHAGPLTQMVLLGNLAVRARQPVEVDAATGAIRTSGIPEEYVSASYRKGWEL